MKISYEYSWWNIVKQDEYLMKYLKKMSDEIEYCGTMRMRMRDTWLRPQLPSAGPPAQTPEQWITIMTNQNNMKMKMILSKMSLVSSTDTWTRIYHHESKQYKHEYNFEYIKCQSQSHDMLRFQRRHLRNNLPRHDICHMHHMQRMCKIICPRVKFYILKVPFEQFM